MQIIIANTYEDSSKLAAVNVEELMKVSPHPLICTASGDSPAGVYKELVRMVNAKDMNVSDWYFVSLDEWAGMNGHDEGSCRFHLNNQLFNPFKVPAERIAFFDGRANDLEKECLHIENFIAEHEGINTAIVGLGMNGHVGMNEPGTLPELYSHVAEIDPETQKAGQKYFKKQQQLSHGLTLGIASLMKAKHIILMVNGSKKARVVQQVLEGKISASLPASLLRNHPDLKVFLDREAASMLHSQ